MQACKDSCLTMLKARTAVQNLDLNCRQPFALESQMQQLHSMDEELSAADRVLLWKQIPVDRLETEQGRLLKCFASLVASLVTKLAACEVALAAGNGADVVACMASVPFWSLMSRVCGAAREWPMPWFTQSVLAYQPVAMPCTA